MQLKQILVLLLVLFLFPLANTQISMPTVDITITYNSVLEVKTYFPDLSFAINNFVGEQITLTSFITYPTNFYEYGGNVRIAEWHYRFDNKSSGNISFSIKAFPTTKTFTGNVDNKETLEWAEERYLGDIYIRTNSGDLLHIVSPKNADIVSLSKSIVGSEDRPYYKAKLIYEWMIENIKVSANSNKYPQTAIETLEKKSGDCDDLTYLYISLLRAAGVPCYSIDGIILRQSDMYKKEIVVKNLHTMAAFIMPSKEKIFEPVFVDIINKKFDYKGPNFIALGFDPGGEQSLDYFTKSYWGVEYKYEKSESGGADIRIIYRN